MKRWEQRRMTPAEGFEGGGIWGGGGEHNASTCHPQVAEEEEEEGRASARRAIGIALPRVGRGTQGDTGESVLASLSRRAEDSLCWPLSTACGSGMFCALSWEILSLYLSLSLWNLTLPLLLLLLCFVQKSFWFYLLLFFAVLSLDCFFSQLFWSWAERGRASRLNGPGPSVIKARLRTFTYTLTHAHTHTEANVSPRREKRGGSARARESRRRRRKGGMLRGRRQEFPGVFKDQTDPL